MNRRRKITAVITVLIAVMTALSLQIFRRPLLRMTSEFYHPFFAPVSKAENYSIRQALLLKTKKELVDQILTQQNLNEQLQAKLLILQDTANDKVRLEELLKIRPWSGFRCIYAEIYIRDPAMWYQSFSVNKGSLDGIVPGSIVLSRTTAENDRKYMFAVTGRISDVTEHSALVQTVVSRLCRLSVVIKDSEAAGILEGGTVENAEPFAKVAYLPAFKSYTPGTEVFTSGFCTGDGESSETADRHRTPGGLFVGTLTKNIRTVNKLSTEAEIKPAVDLDSLRYVIVLVPEGTAVKTH